MNKDIINRTIAEACGVEPQLVEWWAYKPDDTGGRIIMSAPTKEKVEEWIRKNTPTGGYSPKPFFRYPAYTDCLNAIHSAMLTLDDWKEGGDFENHLFRVLIRDKRERGVGHEGVSTFDKIRAEARQLAKAFLLTKNLWTPTGEENE